MPPLESLAPPSPDTLFANAKTAYELQDFEQAARLCNQILETHQHPLVANLLGMSLLKMDKPEFGERVLHEAIALDPNCVAALANLGNYYRENMRIKQAEELLQAAYKLRPDNHQVNHNMSVLCLESGRFEEGLRFARRAQEINPDHEATKHTLSLALLQNGQYDEGTELYEARKTVFLRDKSPLPAYTGGKAKVIIRQEQGFGDTLMVSRWLPKLQEMGADVTLVAPTALYKLMKDSGLCDVHNADADMNSYTHHLWTMDLMRMFGKDWANISGKPYFTADPQLVEKWCMMLGKKKKPRIGFCWSGSSRKDNPHAFIIDKRRSLCISEARSLMHGIDAQWVNLTRELGLPDSTDFSAQIKDFAEMAGLLKNLDLVVTVDTALCHLAGGLGVNTICLHRYDMCWRWHPYTEQTPLYEGMRHFRQPAPFDWQSVIGEVRDEITKLYN